MIMIPPTMQSCRLLITYCGRAWRVRFDADKLREIREATGIDLAADVDDPGGLCRRLGDDLLRLMPAILSIVCREQLVERDLSVAGFHNLLLDFGSEYMTQGICVVLQALADYFPESWLAKLIEPALDQWRATKPITT